MLGSNGGHGGAHTKFARFIGRRAHDGTFATPSDNDGLPAQRGVIPLLYGSIEGVHVDVYDFAHTDSAFILFPAGRSRIRERFEHLRSRLPDVAETFGQNLNISVPNLNVVRSRRTGIKTNGLADNIRGSFRFGFADAFIGRRPTVATVKKFVRQFMRERRELFGR